MSNEDQENRKEVRRNNFNKKKCLDKSNSEFESKDINKMRKQFKTKKEYLRQEELWEEWQDEIH
jgi:hypothetical protein